MLWSVPVKHPLKSQYKDGSWEALWVCVLPMEFVLLWKDRLLMELVITHKAIQRACAYLWSKQKEDGGWGGAQESALAREYIQADASVVDQTAWCILALLNGGYAEDPVN